MKKTAKRKRLPARTLPRPAEQVQQELDAYEKTIEHTIGHRPDKGISLADREFALPVLTFAASEGKLSPEYKMGPLLAEGGMGKVCSAKQIPLHRNVVIKMLRPDKESPERKTLLLQEACLTGYLEHPNIVPIHQLGRDEDDRPMLVMKHIEGEPWSSILRKKKENPELLPEEQRSLEWHIRVLIQVCHAVEYAHSKGILHRDLKPENVMIGEFGEVYVLDWGIAASLNDAHSGLFPLVKNTESVVGTPAYIAPESLLFTEEEDVILDEKTDVYLLGAMLFHVLTGKAPHVFSSVVELYYRVLERGPFPFPNTISEELAMLCNFSMHIDRDLRPDSVKDFRLSLEAYLTNIASYQLSAEAHRLSGELEDLLEKASTEGAISSDFSNERNAPNQKIYSLFWSCHFGFTQALRVSKNNKEARKGLQSLLEMMASYELHRKDVQAAAALISELPKPNPELNERLEAIHQEQLEESIRIQELKKMEFEQDVKFGKSARQAGILLLGGTFGLMSMFVHFMKVTKIYEPEHYGFLVNQICFVLILASILVVWRKSLLVNKANRQMMALIAFLAVTLIIQRLIFIHRGVDVGTAGIVDMTLFFSCMVYLAITQNPFIFIAAFCYFIVVLCGVFFPDLFYLSLGFAHLIATPCLAWFWQSMSKKDEKVVA